MLVVLGQELAAELRPQCIPNLEGIIQPIAVMLLSSGWGVWKYSKSPHSTSSSPQPLTYIRIKSQSNFQVQTKLHN